MESDLCCVCGVHLNQNQRHIVLEQSTHIISLICEWIAPQILSENDYICQICYKRIVQTFEDSMVNKIKETNVGLKMEVFEDTVQSSNSECSKTVDRNVCLMCDTLLSTRRSLLIIKNDPTELDRITLKLISKAIPPEIKINSEDKVCSKCWFKVRKSAINLQQTNKLEPNRSRDEDESVVIKSESSSDHEHSGHLIKIEEIEVQHSELIKSEPEDVDDDSKVNETSDDSDFTIKPVNDKNNGYEYLSDLDPQIKELEDDPEDPDFIATSPKKSKFEKKIAKLKKKKNIDSTKNNALISDEIFLPSYKRAPNINSCLFPKCKNIKTKKICNEIRAKIIKDNKFYIASSGRLCNEHFTSNTLNHLHEAVWPNLKFNAEHIEDMFSMVQEKRSIEIDFSDVFNLDDNLIKYLLGTTREILTTILTREPQILRRSSCLKGLFALFIKHENGSSYLRMSDFLKMSRKGLCFAAKTVQEILSKSPVTKELGLEHILLKK